MKAMVFAAGVGSRLKDLTRDTPKCLMHVGHQTILEHVVENLKQAGVTAITINVHHLADKVVEFVGRRNSFGIEVHFSYEEHLLDTGGGLKRVRSFFEEGGPFIIHNADVYSSIDLAALVTVHTSKNSIGTLAVMERPSRRGLYFDKEMHLKGWTGEATPYSPEVGDQLRAFCGISVASPELFQYMEGGEIFSILAPYLSASRATGRVRGEVVEDAAWVDIGTPEQLEMLNQRLRKA